MGIYAKAAENYVKAHCPSCQIITKDELFATAATNIPADVQDILRANPGIKWIICGDDYQAGFAVQGIQQAGVTGVSVLASGGSTPQLNDVRAGNSPYIADNLVSGVWAGWAGADEIIRLMLGKPAKDRRTAVPAPHTREHSTYKRSSGAYRHQFSDTVPQIMGRLAVGPGLKGEGGEARLPSSGYLTAKNGSAG